jgi:flagellar hook-basal body complex protein FliE
MSAINMISPQPLAAPGLTGPASAAPLQPGAGTPGLAADDFASVFKAMLADVNQSQNQSSQLAAAFERGQHQDLADVMIAQQKARLAFQTTLQVRNKLVTAYQDIMNMPV